jgi:hypothetical protein
MLLLYSMVVLGLNFYVCRNLFGLEFTQQMESIESSYIAISRWAMSNWSDLTWYPLWFNGMPFHQVYQPGLHLSVAAVATAIGWTAPRAYHFVTALTYSGSALTLFWLCRRTARDTGRAFASALFYSLLSPICFFVPLIRADSGGWFTPRRFQILVHYGEGPHTTAVAMIPVVILLLHGAMVRRSRLCIALAPFATAAVVLTNWPGSMGLALAILAYILSRIEGMRVPDWLILIGVAISAYLIASPWVPPDVIALVLRNAQQSDGTSLGMSQLQPLLIVFVILAIVLLAFRLCRADPWLRFFVVFAVITGAVSIGREWFGWRLLPQPNRFQVEFDMAFSGMIGFGLIWVLRALPGKARIGAVAVLLSLVGLQTWNYGRVAHRQTQPIDVTTTIEYRMSKWFEANMGDERVFAPGNVSLWMNTFTDVPQVAGCCDQGIPNHQYRIAVYVIYTGQNAGDRDAAISLLWLRAYGANAIGTVGPNSTEYFKPFWNWKKFDGFLPELWRSGENVVYRVPRKSVEPVRVIPKAAIASRAPANGLDVEPIEPFVSALEDPVMPAATFRWVNRHEANVEASTEPGQVVFLQISYGPGWRAIEDGIELPIVNDPLGMMYVEPKRRGLTRIRFVYEGGPWNWSRQWIFAALGVTLVGVLLKLRSQRDRDRARELT